MAVENGERKRDLTARLRFLGSDVQLDPGYCDGERVLDAVYGQGSNSVLSQR